MVTVTFTRRGRSFCIDVQGHAGSAPRGEDLVCCAASTLAYTAAQSALQLYEAGLLERFPDMEMHPGIAKVAAMATRDGLVRVEQMFSTVCAGFKLLAQQYPAYIQFGDRA